MKRTYEKPLFAAEIFTLNQCIALDCGDNLPFSKDELNFADPMKCGWYLGPGNIMFSPGGACTIEGVDACYNNPSDDDRIFRS